MQTNGKISFKKFMAWVSFVGGVIGLIYEYYQESKDELTDNAPDTVSEQPNKHGNAAEPETANIN